MVPLRHLLPAVLMSISIISVIFFYSVTLPELRRAMTYIIESLSTDRLHYLQNRLSASYELGPERDFPIEIFNAVSDPTVLGIYIVTEDLKIKYAHRSRFVGAPLETIQPLQDRSLLQKAIVDIGMSLEPFSISEGIVTGYAGIKGTKDDGTIERLGVVIQMDFKATIELSENLAKRPAEWTLGLLTAVSLVISFLMRIYLDGRQTLLFRVLGRLSEGQPADVQNFPGNDEFADIGRNLVGVSEALRQDRELIEQYRERTDRLMGSKKELVGRLSRDLRGPVTSVQGFLDLLGHQSLPEKAQFLTQQALISARSLAGHTGEMLELAGLDERNYRSKKEPTNITLLLQQIYDSILPFARVRGKKVIIQNEDNEDTWLLLDGLIWRGLVIFSLTKIIESLKSDHVALVCDVEARDMSRIILTIKLRGRFLPNQLVDAAEPNQDKRRKSQGDIAEGRSRSLEPFSSNLPEAVQAFVEPTLAVLHKSQGGHVFSLRAGPTSQDDEIAFQMEAVAQAPGEDLAMLLSSIRADVSLSILMVEPDRVTLCMMEEALKRQGHVVTGVSSEKEALSQLQDRAIYSVENLPDLILISLDLSERGAEELLTEIRGLTERLKTVPVIGLASTWKDADLLLDRLILSEILYLPVSMDALTAAVNRVSKVTSHYKAQKVG